MSVEIGLIGLILFFSVITQTITGFGGVVITVTLSALFYKIELLPPILVPLNLIITSWIVWKDYKSIDTKFILKNVMPVMGSGIILGVFIFQYYQSEHLKDYFAIVIIMLALTELPGSIEYRIKRLEAGINAIPAIIWIFVSGIMHGMYASGGPFLVYATGRKNLAKKDFRVTLSCIWLVFNMILTVWFIYIKRINLENLMYILYFIPVVLLGMYFGDWLHNKVPEKKFSIFVYIVLLFAGIALLLRQ